MPRTPAAHLAGSLLLSTRTVAFIQAHRTFRQGRNTKKSNAAFLAMVDKGTIGLNAAMADAPYAYHFEHIPALERAGRADRQALAAADVAGNHPTFFSRWKMAGTLQSSHRMR